MASAAEPSVAVVQFAFIGDSVAIHIGARRRGDVTGVGQTVGIAVQLAFIGRIVEIAVSRRAAGEVTIISNSVLVTVRLAFVRNIVAIHVKYPGNVRGALVLGNLNNMAIRIAELFRPIKL